VSKGNKKPDDSDNKPGDPLSENMVSETTSQARSGATVVAGSGNAGPTQHPSRRLEMRSAGYGIAAGYEKPYKRLPKKKFASQPEVYGPIPHSGYYGAGDGDARFTVGQAGFREELEWYRDQYGNETSGFND
jgi:hypothetical protein